MAGPPGPDGAQERRKEGENGAGFGVGILTSAQFDAAQFRRDWLVTGLLVRDEPVIFGGPKKSLKTSLTVDLAVSLGTATPFLGKFGVPQRRRVLVLSGESGLATLQETARRVCRARNVALVDCDALWYDRLPRLSHADDLGALQEVLVSQAVAVVIIDPLYLCLLQSGLNVSAANLFEVGPLLLRVARLCREAGATPILIHHARKQSAQAKAAYQPMELDDLAFAGFAEFARQWILVSRRVPYDPNSGVHKLWLQVGGSAGQGRLCALEVTEGRLGDDFAGRTWQVKVLKPEAARTLAELQKQDDKAQQQQARQQAARVEVMRVLCKHPEGETFTRIRDLATCPKNCVGQVLSQLEAEKLVEQTELTKPAGKGSKTYNAWKPTARLLRHRHHHEEPSPGFPFPVQGEPQGGGALGDQGEDTDPMIVAGPGEGGEGGPTRGS